MKINKNKILLLALLLSNKNIFSSEPANQPVILATKENVSKNVEVTEVEEKTLKDAKNSKELVQKETENKDLGILDRLDQGLTETCGDNKKYVIYGGWVILTVLFTAAAYKTYQYLNQTDDQIANEEEDENNE